MAQAFKASKLAGLLALVLGAMAFSATAAQAEEGAYWSVNGTPILDNSLLPEVQITELENGIGTLLTTVGLSTLEIDCTDLSFKEALLHKLGSATGGIHFSGCVTRLNKSETPAAACKPHSPEDPPGLIETNPLDGLIKLHDESDHLVELLPEVGGVFVTIVLGEGECSIGEKFDITGKAFLQDADGEGLVEKVTHLVEQGPLTDLKFGSRSATIHGSAIAALDGTHVGDTWSGHTEPHEE
jgi:hypothetical protein